MCPVEVRLPTSGLEIPGDLGVDPGIDRVWEEERSTVVMPKSSPSEAAIISREANLCKLETPAPTTPS